MIGRAIAWISNLVGNNPAYRWLIILFALVFIIFARCCLHPAKAGELHLEVGVSVIHGYGPYIGVYYQASDKPKLIDFEAGLQMWGRTSPYEGQEVPNNWAPSVMMDVNSPKNFHVGLGFVYLQHSDWLDGSRLNISLKMGYDWNDRWGIDIRHISNAGTTPRNVGRNAILLDWRLR